MLWLVRHAKAEDGHPLGDAARALTPKGREKFRRFARKLAKHARIESIASSPAIRAVQTAELLAEALGLSRIDIRGELRGTRGDVEALARELGDGWALVGHEPSISEAAADLQGLRSDWPLKVKKGAVIAFEDSRFVWYWAPGLTRVQSLEASPTES